VSRYDPQRDPVRVFGRRLRWSLRWLIAPAAIGVFVAGNADVHSLPLIGPERESAVLLQDGQAYFGHLDDSGEGGMLLLRDVYYFKDASGSPTGLAVSLVRRGAEAHEPADGMRINRDKVLAVEQVGPTSPVAQAIAAERELAHTSPAPLTLNRVVIAGPDALVAQRTAGEHDIARAYAAAADQLAKLNDLVLPVTKSEATTITQKATDDLRAVRRSAVAALATLLGMSAADAEAYARASDAQLEGQTFPNDASVLLAPDVSAVVDRAAQLYAQVGDAAAKQLTQPRATPAPSASPSASPSPRP
jgi:hypothetical protein